jgi:hypothetical protein
MRFFFTLNVGVYLAVMQCQECSQNIQGKPNESVRKCMTTRVASSLSSSNKNKNVSRKSAEHKEVGATFQFVLQYILFGIYPKQVVISIYFESMSVEDPCQCLSLAEVGTRINHVCTYAGICFAFP